MQNLDRPIIFFALSEIKIYLHYLTRIFFQNSLKCSKVFKFSLINHSCLQCNTKFLKFSKIISTYVEFQNSYWSTGVWDTMWQNK